MNYELKFLVAVVAHLSLAAMLVLTSVSCAVEPSTAQQQINANAVVANNTNSKQLEQTLPTNVAADNSVQSDSGKPTELDTNRLRWRQSKIQNYEMLLQVSEGGMYSAIAPASIEVRDGQAVGTPLVIEQGQREAHPFANKFERYNSVEKLFDAIEQAQRQPDKKLAVKYDSTSGRPIEITIEEPNNIHGRTLLMVKTFKSLEL